MTSYPLTDAEIVLLDGYCRPETQAHVNAAKARLRAIRSHPELTAGRASLVADAVTSATTNGFLVYRPVRLRYCRACERDDGYAVFKSGWRKGESDPKRPLTFAGWELDSPFISMRGYVSVGGCDDCVTAITPALTEALRGVPAEVPECFRAVSEPPRKRHTNRHCTSCGWKGHEGEMGRLRTLMGDGYYPGACPQCGAENLPLRDPVIEIADGFTVVEVKPARRPDSAADAPESSVSAPKGAG